MNHDDFNEAERRSKLRMQVIYEGAKKPKREWVGLTEEEREEIALEVPMDAVCITEAKLKEKNT
jgi:hypothetical protein